MFLVVGLLSDLIESCRVANDCVMDGVEPIPLVAVNASQLTDIAVEGLLEFEDPVIIGSRP